MGTFGLVGTQAAHKKRPSSVGPSPTDAASASTFASVKSPVRIDQSSPVKDGKVIGSVEISPPEKFWSASKYLILVQD